MDSITTLSTTSASYAQTSPTKRQKCNVEDVLKKNIYGDVLRRMVAFLDCYHVNLLGQLNRIWKKCIFSDKKKIPWITGYVSLFIENYTKSILFDAKNQPALIKNKQYKQLMKIERSVEGVQIFPSAYIHRFCVQNLLNQYTQSIPNLQKLKLTGKVDFEDFILIECSHFNTLKSLKFTNHCSKITDKDLGRLSCLETLEKLKLHDCSQITHVNFTRLTSLQTLYLDNGPHVTHINLEAYTALRNLSITNCLQITNSSLMHFSRLAKLKTLNFYKTSIGNATLLNLKNFTKLRSLNLSKCLQITDFGLSYLTVCTTLHTLFLSACSQITDQALSHLSHLSTLMTLDLSECAQITGRGLIPLQGLTELTYLDLSGCRISDTCLSHLESLSTLRHLYLCNCSELTSKGFSHLKALTELQCLHLKKCPKIDDTAVPYLSMCTTLKHLFHKYSCITDNGLRSLQKQLPELTIYPELQSLSSSS